MQAQKFLGVFARRADSFLARFFDEKEKQAKRVSPLASEIIKVFREYSEGGKKVRGGLTLLGYQAAGGNGPARVLPAACGVELFHNFLLIHDDLIDQDKIRRGKPTVHEYYKAAHQKRYKNGNPIRYGENMAIMAGDVGAFLGYELFLSSKLPHERIVKAASLLNDFLVKTAYGEIFDVTFDFKEELTWNEMILVRTYKTAYYTVVMPLSVGATLAGASRGQLLAISAYGTPVGIAFQIVDDILGVFGQEKKTGKTSEGDIKEGKKTLLLAKATELATPRERRFLKAFYGKADISAQEIAEIKRIIKDSGALEFCSQYARRLADQGKEAIPRITKNRDVAQTLASFADFVVEREK